MCTELKPCPFCGGKASLLKRGNDYTRKRSAEIRCEDCKAMVLTGAIRNSLEWCERTVIEKWNKRIVVDNPTCDHNWVKSVAYKGASYCSKCHTYK